MAMSNIRTRQDPAFLFYSADFLARTYGWTNDQVGAYTKLLCLQHQNGHLSKETMKSICEGEDEKVFSKFTEDENSLYFDPEVELEIERRSKYSKSRSENAKSGWNKRKETEDTLGDNIKDDDSLPF